MSSKKENPEALEGAPAGHDVCQYNDSLLSQRREIHRSYIHDL